MACSAIQLSGQEPGKIKARFTTWYQNKAGAISLSFDDAGYSQYEFAYPLLEKYGFKGTFSIVGEWVAEEPTGFAETGYFEIKRMGWKQLLELHDHGHELSAHGMLHQRYDKFLPVAELTGQMSEIKTLIESRINDRVYTIHYPYSYASGNIPVAAGEAGYLFGRTGLDTINSSSPGTMEMYLLSSQAILNDDLPDSVKFAHWLKQTENKWLILMYHHFFTPDSKEMSIMKYHDVEYSYSISPAKFEKQLEAMAVSGYWVATIREVGKYITQRDHNEILLAIRKKKIKIDVGSSLDKTVYNQPMTIEIEIPWEKVKVEGSLNDGIFENRGNRIFIDVLPSRQIILTKE